MDIILAYQNVFRLIQNRWCVNVDTNPVFSNPKALPQFQEGLQTYKKLLKELVNNQEKSTTIYKFGDGDYRFLKGQAKVVLNQV